MEQLVEMPFARIFKSRLHPADLAKELARAMERGATADANGNVVAPNLYTVRINPADLASLENVTDVSAEIAAMERYLSALVQETESVITAPLHVEISGDAAVAAGDIAISAENQTSPAAVFSDTKRFQPSLPPANHWHIRLPDGAMRLGMPIVRIGRDADNDVALAHPTVSRHHAQLRWQNGIYFVENLSRTQPLGVNFKPAPVRTPLKAGDALQLGQVTIHIEIYP